MSTSFGTEQRANNLQTSKTNIAPSPEQNRAELADTLGAIYRATTALTRLGMRVVQGKDVGPEKVERVAAALFPEGVDAGKLYPSLRTADDPQLKRCLAQFNLDNNYQLSLLASVLKSAELTGTIAASSPQFGEIGATLKGHADKLREIIARASGTSAFASLERSTSVYLSSLPASLNNTTGGVSNSIRLSFETAGLTNDEIGRISKAIFVASADPKGFITGGLLLEEPNVCLPTLGDHTTAGATISDVASDRPSREDRQAAASVQLTPAQNRALLEETLVAIHHVTTTLQQLGMRSYHGNTVDSVKAPRVAASLFPEGADVGAFYSHPNKEGNTRQFKLDNHYQLSLLASALMQADITAAIGSHSPQFADVSRILKGHAEKLRTIIARASGTKEIETLLSITTGYLDQSLRSVGENSQSKTSSLLSSFDSAGLAQNDRRAILSALGTAYSSPDQFIMNGIQVNTPVS